MKARTVRKGVDLGVFAGVPVNTAETSESVLSIHVHGTRTADTLSAGAAKSEGRVDLVLDLDEGIKHLYIRECGSETSEGEKGRVGGYVPWDLSG